MIKNNIFLQINIIVLIVFTLFISACSNKIYELPVDKHYPFSEKVKEVFGKDTEVTNSLNKIEVQSSSAKVLKENLGVNNLDKFEILLNKEGWVLKGKGVGMNTYCLEKNNLINIIYSESGRAIDYLGNVFNVMNEKNMVSIGYAYNMWGIDICE